MLKFNGFLLINLNLPRRVTLQYQFQTSPSSMKLHHPSSNENTLLQPRAQDSPLEWSSKTSEERLLACISNRNDKEKRIKRKPETVLRRLAIQAPLTFSHVYNFLNILGVNEWALRDKNYEQSFFKSMFYIRTVERVQVRKHAIIIQLKSLETAPFTIQYLINRYKSFGDQDFYQLACKMETVAAKFKQQEFQTKLVKSFDSEPLSRYIDSMQGEIYMCRVAPNKLVISRGLLELLGEDPELYAIEVCKYKMPLREIISTECYSEVIAKSVQNVGLICDYLNEEMSIEELHESTSLNFNDYIYNRQNKKIYCKLSLYMPTPLSSCIHVREIISQAEEVKPTSSNYDMNKQLVEAECQRKRYGEAETLKGIIRMPDALLASNKQRLAGYRVIDNSQLAY